MIKKTLYFGSPVYLSLERSQLHIQKREKNDLSEFNRPIEDIGILVLDHPQITITHGAIRALQENKAVVVSCNEKHLPHSLLLPLQGHSEQSKRFRVQLTASEPLKKRLWQQTIQAKIRNQRRVLDHLGQPSKRLRILERRVKSGDPENIEGQAAAYYWSVFLEDFLRDRYGSEPNGLLNYGYAILRSLVARSLISTGLHLSIGIHHKNKYNALCLADDIMEPLRPFIDLMVYDLYIEQDCPDFLSKEAKKSLLGLSQTDGIFKKHRRPLMVGLSQTTASLFQCYEGGRRKIIYPKLPMSA
jgi:CRISPR-associated protein Cas1